MKVAKIDFSRTLREYAPKRIDDCGGNDDFIGIKNGDDELDISISAENDNDDFDSDGDDFSARKNEYLVGNDSGDFGATTTTTTETTKMTADATITASPRTKMTMTEMSTTMAPTTLTAWTVLMISPNSQHTQTYIGNRRRWSHLREMRVILQSVVVVLQLYRGIQVSSVFLLQKKSLADRSPRVLDFPDAFQKSIIYCQTFLSIPAKLVPFRTRLR